MCALRQLGRRFAERSPALDVPRVFTCSVGQSPAMGVCQ